MIPKLLCSSCGNELSPQDKFCSRCGAKVTFEGTSGEPPVTTTVNCRLCGSENSVDSKYCNVCGALLSKDAGAIREKQVSRGKEKTSQPERQPHVERRHEKRSVGPRRGLEGWKIVAAVGGVLVVAVIVIGVKRNQPVGVSSGSPAQSSVSPTLVKDIEQLRKVVATDSTNSGALLRLANLLHDGKFLDQAIIYYKKYVVLNENDPDARVDLGICYFESGDKERAIAEMKKALSVSPKHQLAHFNLGIVNLGSGDIESAFDWFKKCIAIAPQTETACRAQELIDQHAASTNLKLN